ncbi:hypothetical protein FQA39_LY00833 [Lamprigera yunnana]|nr:hypothetical protein FQA39_LY00833 [Lamprigera yunnana]
MANSKCQTMSTKPLSNHSIFCPWTSRAPLTSTTTHRFNGKAVQQNLSRTSSSQIPMHCQHNMINTHCPSNVQVNCGQPTATMPYPSIQQSTNLFFHFLRLMQLFPDVHPATLHTTLVLCKNNFFCAVDKLIYAKRCKAVYNEQKQFFQKTKCNSRYQPYVIPNSVTDEATHVHASASIGVNPNSQQMMPLDATTKTFQRNQSNGSTSNPMQSNRSLEKANNEKLWLAIMPPFMQRDNWVLLSWRFRIMVTAKDNYSCTVPDDRWCMNAYVLAPILFMYSECWFLFSNYSHFFNSDVWVETKMSEGNAYYYNVSTRETIWTKPEGQNIRIISQNQLEAVTRIADRTIIPRGSLTVADAALVQRNVTIKGKDTLEMRNAASHRPISFMQGSSVGTRLFGGPPKTMQIEGPPYGMLPLGYQNNCGPGSPPWVEKHFHATPWEMSSHLMLSLQQFRESAGKAKVDPKRVAKASELSEHRTPERILHYYNKKKEKPKWKTQQPLEDSDTAKLAATERISITPGTLNIVQNQFFANGDNLPHNVSVVEEYIEKRKNIKEDAKEQKPKEQKIQDKSRPISYAPVPKTPWFVVWTGDGKIFFYNPFAGTSIWERPDSLVGRSDVDKIINNPPNTPRKLPSKKLSASKVSDDEQGDYSKRLMVKTHGNSNGTPQAKKMITVGEAAVEVEVCAAKERSTTPLDRRIKFFREMLTEIEVSAFSTWEKELPKIVSDPRLLLTLKERKQIFEKHLRETAEEEYREKCNRLNEHIDAFQHIVEDLLTTKQDMQVPLTIHNQLVHGNEIDLQNLNMNSGCLQLNSKSPKTLLQIAPNVQLLEFDNTVNRTMAIVWNQNSKNQSKITTAATKNF